MKKFYSLMQYALCALFFLGAVSAVNAQCTYTLDLEDSWGDGWNGNTVGISIGGDLTEYGQDFTSGSSASYTFDVPETDPPTPLIVTFATDGLFTGECSLTLTNCDGEVVYDGPLDPNNDNEVGDLLYVYPPDCELTCGEDIVVDNDPGTCGAQVTVPNPETTDGCTTMALDGTCEEFEASTELVFSNTTVLGELQETTLTLDGLPDLPAVVESVDVEVCVNGDFGDSEDELTEISFNGTVVDTLGNELSGDCGQYCTTINVLAADYMTTMEFVLAANTDVNPICATQELSASVCIPNVATFEPLVVNDFNNTGDASGVYPLGTTVVTFTSQGASGIQSTCTLNVIVNDTEAPVLECPSDMIINLDAGECGSVVNAVITAAENCPPVEQTFAGPFCDPSTITESWDALACAPFASNSIMQYVEFPVSGQLTQVCFYQETFTSSPQITVNAYEGSSNGPVPYTAGGFTPVASQTYQTSTANNDENVCVEFSTPADVTAGGLWLEVYTPGFTLNSRAVATGESCGGEDADGSLTYIYAASCGINEPTLMSEAAGGFDLDAAFSVVILPSELEAVQTNYDSNGGYALGDEFPIGTTVMEFEAVDAAGNSATCSFNVVVNEYPEELQTKNLACNDHINVSVDNTCTAVITSDMMLEGGPYGCYDSYNVSIAGLPAGAVSGNGTNAITINASNIAAFVANGMAGPYELSVIDPDNGNNMCWGTIMLEDKLAPSITCSDITLNCDDPTALGAQVSAPGLYSYSVGAGTEFNNTTDADLEVAAGYIGEVTSVTVDVDITHTWIGDIDLEVTSPAGTSVELYSGNCGTQDDIKATFADGGDDFDCSNSAAGLTFASNDPLADFAGEDANGVWTVKVSDTAAGDDGVINNITLNINATGASITGASIVDNCAGGNVAYTEVEVDGDCNSEYARQIVRTWTGTDAKGNESPACVQTISVKRETLATLTTPYNYDGLNKPTSKPMLSCEAGYPTPDVTGQPGGVGNCGTIESTYTDVILPICDQDCATNNSSYKILREWKIVDWCTGEIVDHNQIIKVMDTKAPVINSVVITNRGQNIVVKDGDVVDIYTDIWGCGASYTISSINAVDNCSEEVSTYPSKNSVVTIPASAKCTSQDQVVKASDCCGNEDEISFTVNVIDNVPPAVVAETSRIVALTTDGIGKIFAESFDDGSHDGCGAIGFAVKRMDNGGQCSAIDKYLPTGDDNKQFNEMVHFCCKDAGDEPVMVQFMVCDDANCDGLFDFKENSKKDNCNTAMVEVYVQDKLAPVISCPAPATISCVDVAGIDWDNDELVDNMFGGPQAGATCPFDDVERKTTVKLDCPDAATSILGFVVRSFKVKTAAGVASCSQKITVMGDNTTLLTCDRISLDLDAQIFKDAKIKGANLRQFGYDDPTVKDPYKGFDSHWCAYNGRPSAVDKDDNKPGNDKIPSLNIGCDDGFEYPAVLVNIDGLCTEAGTTVTVTDTFAFAGGACKKYLVHYEVIDNCLFDENFVNPTTGEIDPYHSDNGYFELYLEINAFDDEGPELDCAPVNVPATTCTGLNTTVTIDGTDNCTTDKNEWGYQWRVDVGADNTIDNDWVSASGATPADLGLEEFPIGKHIFYWVVSDGCGNTSTCSKVVTITPNEKAPTPICYDGIATAVMPINGEVTLWASDFDAHSEAACPGDLTFTMIPEALAQESANPFQESSADWTFTCEDLEPYGGVSAQFLVRIYVIDANGNKDYCTASLRINDNNGVCPNSGTVTYEVSGKVATEAGAGVNNVDVTVKADYPEFPMTQQTDVDGNYSFANANGVGYLYQNVDYTVVPELDKDYLNGVTTLDIVMIQKHILGLESLDSPYKLIAADANSDCKVTGTDLVQLRKLILGLYDNDNLPQNTSWRFVDKDYVFANANKPCGFAEATSIVNMSADEVDNFVAAKIGDVNGTASNNVAGGNAATRSNNALKFVVNEGKMEAGNTYKVNFLAKDFADVYGYQYTLELTGAEFVGVEAGALNVTEENFGLAMANNGVVTTSYDNVNGATLADDAVLFTMTVRATVNTNVSDVLNITSRRTSAEAYVGAALEIQGAKIEFRTDNGDVSAEKFALYQNEPNPFNGSTQIGFELPKASRATLSVYDVTGKVLYTNVNDYAAGYNVVTLSKAQLNATGVMYYKLESDDNVATMKMIIIE